MGMRYDRHQGPEEPDDTEITEEEYDNMAKRNVERWISAHILPVRPHYRYHPVHPANSRDKPGVPSFF